MGIAVFHGRGRARRHIRGQRRAVVHIVRGRRLSEPDGQSDDQSARDGQAATPEQVSGSAAEIEVRDTNVGQLPEYGGRSPVGFAEIRLRNDAPNAPPVVFFEA